MKITSIRIISEFENYEEFLNCIKSGKTVYRKASSCCGNFFDEYKMCYDSEKDCFYSITPNGPSKGHRNEYPFKTAKDFEKETNNHNVIGLNHKQTYADVYPLENYYMVEYK